VVRIDDRTLQRIGDEPPSPMSWLILKGGVLLGIVALLVLLWAATHCVVIVDTGHVAILIKKTGLDLPEGEIAAPSEAHKGIQQRLLPEGWHLLNPYV
jgi:hypothetical protein